MDLQTQPSLKFDHKNFENLSGVLLVDKPAGINSHAVVSRIKKLLKINKVGHLGTLDPFASGLLPILIGGATRLAEGLMGGKKGYLFTIKLGYQTDTLDLTGQTISEKNVPEICETEILDVLKKFEGHIMQEPPTYSALKMNGRPLYEYMRSTGCLPQDISTKTREIFIQSCDFVDFDKNQNTITVRTVCSKGTYIRSLARDIALKLGTVGTCITLRREYVEPWDAQNALDFNLVDRKTDISVQEIIEMIISPEQLCPDIKKILIPEHYLKALSSGNVMIVSKETYPEIFDESKFSQLNQEVFIQCVGHTTLMFLGEMEFISSTSVKIMPRKKIV